MIQAVARKWEKLAVELGFKPSVIESIGSRYNDSEEGCEFMLRKWLIHQDRMVSWEVLMTALDKVGLHSITQDLEKGNCGFRLLYDDPSPPHFSHVLHDYTRIDSAYVGLHQLQFSLVFQVLMPTGLLCK